MNEDNGSNRSIEEGTDSGKRLTEEKRGMTPFPCFNLTYEEIQEDVRIALEELKRGEVLSAKEAFATVLRVYKKR